MIDYRSVKVSMINLLSNSLTIEKQTPDLAGMVTGIGRGGEAMGHMCVAGALTKITSQMSHLLLKMQQKRSAAGSARSR